MQSLSFIHALKQVACAIGRSMAALVATERHLWLNLTGIKDKDKSFLLDASISPQGLFGDKILLWAETRLLSLRAIFVPEHINREADFLSRQVLRPGEWRLHPQVVESVWQIYSRAEVDLFASEEANTVRCGTPSLIQPIWAWML
ncbi:hypothetical protein QTP70_000903 [Hemibagrus guttatus]|uniref:Uncharacterized protein n=1 Tax=Hemibagrus guttatus TaxID=175788 RepID=A0AAE0QPR6_9TELE|nr:hypothetical protein QTP70_000903 [Hemibagrus guttatus]KAK3559057.1 hypothetical protein QTP86_001102 [Hemibagrus guttatus]